MRISIGDKKMGWLHRVNTVWMSAALLAGLLLPLPAVSADSEVDSFPRRPVRLSTSTRSSVGPIPA